MLERMTDEEFRAYVAGRGPGRDRRPDAGGLPQGPDQVHRDARELGAHGRPARARVDPARAHAPAEARPHCEGAGRGRPRPAHLPRRRGPRQAARGVLRRPDRRQDEVPQRLPLPDEDLGRRRRHRLARRRGGDHLPEGAPQVLLRAVRADHEEDLLGGVVPHPPRPRRRAHDDDRARTSSESSCRRRSTAGGARSCSSTGTRSRPRTTPCTSGGSRARRTRRPASSSSTATSTRSGSSASQCPIRHSARTKTGVWHYTEPDWDELKWVVTGHGPATERRLGLRRASRDETAWVRRAVLADAA